MRQGIQAELKDTEVNEYGCYALSIIEWACREQNINLSDDLVLDIINRARHQGYIGSECFVQNPPALYNLVAGKTVYTEMIKTTAPSKPRSIACNKKPMYTHFTLWDGDDTWDPLPPDRSSAKSYKIDSWRVLK